MTVKQLLLLEWHSGQSGQQLPCRLAKVGDGGAAAGGGKALARETVAYSCLHYYGK